MLIDELEKYCKIGQMEYDFDACCYYKIRSRRAKEKFVTDLELEATNYDTQMMTRVLNKITFDLSR